MRTWCFSFKGKSLRVLEIWLQRFQFILSSRQFLIMLFKTETSKIKIEY
jgi:hypothetical protein